MFEKYIKNSKIYKLIECKNKYLLEDRTKLEQANQTLNHERVELGIEIANLSKEIEVLKSSGAASIADGNSSVIFEFDKELAITVKSRINSDIIMKLIDEKYITAEFSEDEASIQFAFILMANEATEQIIEGINQNEN